MQSLNVMILGKGYFLEDIQKSKYLSKLYISSDIEIEGITNIKFNTFRELAQKCKTLQIDIVIVEEEKWILQGVADVMKRNFINCLAPTAKWTNLQLSNFFAGKLLNKYGINIPPKVILPNEYPLIMRADGIIKIVNSLQEIIDIKQSIYNSSPEIARTIYLEKYIDGEKYNIISLFDGKHLLTFPNANISDTLLKDYSLKLENMLLNEKADFMGFINSKLIQSDGKLYNTGFSFEFLKPVSNVDILFLLSSAVYQKLNEIVL